MSFLWLFYFQSSDFPLSVEMLLSVLEVIAPFKHFTKLRKFVQMKLPPGFPVKLGKYQYFEDFLHLHVRSLVCTFSLADFLS